MPTHRRQVDLGPMPTTFQELAAAVGRPVPHVVVAYTNVAAYEGELWCCDVCGSVIAAWPEDHPFVDTDRNRIDPFERHAKWHKAIAELESRVGVLASHLR